MEENLNSGISGTETGTVAATDSTAEQVESPVVNEPTFTKSQVNEMMTKRINRSHQAFFNRYGVKDLNELDDMFGKSKYYDETKMKNDELTQKYGDLETQHKDLNKRYAYKVGNIDENKIADIETYFKGKGIDIDENTLMAELKTHPDWVNKVATIQQLGAEVQTPTEKDARNEAARIFGVTFHH